MAKRYIGKYNSKLVKVPTASRVVKVGLGESLILFPTFEDKRYFIGWGMIKKISKGEKFDLLYIDFGIGVSKCFVKSLNARKQISICKKNQYVEVYGLAIYQNSKKNEIDIVDKRVMNVLFLDPKYVPLMVDIKRDEKEFEEQIEKMNEEDIQDGNDFLTKFEM